MLKYLLFGLFSIILSVNAFAGSSQQQLSVEFDSSMSKAGTRLYAAGYNTDCSGWQEGNGESKGYWISGSKQEYTKGDNLPRLEIIVTGPYNGDNRHDCKRTNFGTNPYFIFSHLIIQFNYNFTGVNTAIPTACEITDPFGLTFDDGLRRKDKLATIRQDDDGNNIANTWRKCGIDSRFKYKIVTGKSTNGYSKGHIAIAVNDLE